MAHRLAGWALAIALIAAAAPPPGRAAEPPTAVAETPASAQARRLLDAIVTRDDPGFLAVLHEIAPRSPMSDDQWLALRSNLRRLEFHNVLSATPTTAELSVFDAGREAWARVVVTVEPAAPYAIATFGMRGGRRPADVPAPPKLEPAALAQAITARLDAEAAADRFSGAVLVAKDGKPIFTAVRGLADRETGAPITADTQFRYGSMGKMLTAVAALRLAQDGKLDLDAPIGRYLKGYPNPDAAAKIAANHLLTHTGGTGDIFGPIFDANRLTLREPADYVALYGPRPLEFAPGSRMAYSNYGYILLGRLVEAASGLPFDAYVQRHIYGPARMTSSGMLPETANLPHRATGYTTRGGPLRSAAAFNPYRGTPAGGGYSTSGDLLRFANALMSGRLLDAKHLKLLTEGGITGPDGTFFRYDFGGVTGEGQRFLGHGGAAPGMSGVLRIFPDSGYALVVLANRDPPSADGLATFIGDRLPAGR